MKHRIYIILFFLLCLFPVAAIPIFGTAQPAGNETLASAPSLTKRDGSFNEAVLENFSDYVGDRFALRQEMITLNHQLCATLFHQSGSEDVILGKEGWLFYSETLDDYEGTNRFTSREIWAAAHTLSLMEEYCGSQGADFLFTIAPNKNSLYGAYMPDRFPASQSPSNAQLLAQALADENVPYLDLFQLLGDQEEILYRRLDSHWTQRGAGLAGDALLAACGAENVTPFYGSSYVQVQEETGDLYEMLYPAGKELDTDEIYDRPFTFTYTSPIRSPEDNLIFTSSDGQSGSLLMFRDSFGNALHLFMAEGFGSAVFCRITPYDLGMLGTYQCDTVVVELVERNLDWLLTRAPIFPAPERDVSWESCPSAQQMLAISVDGSENSIGCLKITGSLEGCDIDDASPVYLEIDGTVYEATPSGEGSLPFTAYIPAELQSAQVTVLAYVQGSLTRFPTT